MTGGVLEAATVYNYGSLIQTGGVSKLGALIGVGNFTVGGGTGNATAKLDSFIQQNVTIGSGGRLMVNLSAARASNAVNALGITGDGVLDIGNGRLFVENAATPIGAIKQYIQNGYHYDPTLGYGDWNGTGGITSALAIARPDRFTIGYIDGAVQNDPGIGSLSAFGFPFALATNRIYVSPCLTGDLNFDGVVDDKDMGIITRLGYYGTGAAPHGWFDGDLNLDGVVDGKDIELLHRAESYGNVSYDSTVAEVVNAPEPSVVSLLGISAFGLLGRRRKVDACIVRSSKASNRTSL
jgi:hypothetical protein